MSIGELVSYVALCEGCDEAPDDTGLPTREAAQESAVAAGWICEGDLILCPRCNQEMFEPDDPWQLNMFPEIAP